ncbi:5-hydroxytryptamine receptor 3B-like [Boleophthalmus pectinirostris]|uniref:5-hydroxytryptamine receptor 3B-like n=1 Tax=Boleophthalmus pectinirostris TaxID=150288 RepID=UPI00242A8CEE|nr:5-hydroxytryptamine receptor 3B-like [Boleophthalmus pectinirostris]
MAGFWTWSFQALRETGTCVLEIYTGCYGNYGTAQNRDTRIYRPGRQMRRPGRQMRRPGRQMRRPGRQMRRPKQNCSYHSVLEHIQLSKKSDLFTLSRPVWNHTKPTDVLLDIIVYAILDVREIDQTMVSYVWTVQIWPNDFIRWNRDDFCGIEWVSIPVDKLWTPDITIEEMTEKDKSTPSPFIYIKNNGSVAYKNDQVIISTCRLHIYKFPFDTQRCNLSYRSVLLDDKELSLRSFNSTETTQWSLDVMRTQYEWIFRNVTVTKSKVNPFGYDQDMITYTILMERRSILYIANFILPVLFFLVLDFASFLISDSGGEKLGFKVTVLLAVTVMQLLLNEILPASSNRIPLIAVGQRSSLSLMLLSLLESILVLYLINRDQRPDQDQSASYRPLQDPQCGSHPPPEPPMSFNHLTPPSVQDTQPEIRACRPVVEAPAFDCHPHLCGSSWILLRVVGPQEDGPTSLLGLSPVGPHGEGAPGWGSDVLRLTRGLVPLEFITEKGEVSEQVLSSLLNHLQQNQTQEEAEGYWTRKSVTIHRVFFIFYLTSALSFLGGIFYMWTSPSIK